MPKTPTPADLRNLLQPRSEPCISIFLPLPRHGADLATAPLRYRALLREAEGLLADRYDPRRVKELLAPLAGLAEAGDVLGRGPGGLAAFRAEGLFETYRIWPEPPERAVVADSFHVKPLLRCVQDRDRWFVLALGARQASLWEGSGGGLAPRALPPLPAPAPSRGGAPRGGRAAGPGKAPDEGDGARREETLRFCRAVDSVLRDILDPNAVLLVAGAPHVVALFRETCGHRGLAEEAVEGAFDEAGAEELHARALPAARRALAARDQAVVDDFRRQLDRSQAADVLTRVAEASVAGRVRRLLVADGRPLFGRVDRTTGEVTLHAGQTGPQDDDVLDDLAEIVLARGGEVLVLAPERMPDEAAAVATFRW
jgi:hypothetical protein